ncbi:MAG: hypothetical protein JZU55_15075 [Afipia sp.]|nr:hypothetical protein [Afipia sp.]
MVESYAAVLKSYGIKRATGDKYAGGFVPDNFKKHGISYDASAKAKSDLYRDALPLINSKKVDLLDHPRMVQQFVGLERRAARSGKDSIDHAPNSHDDVCNAVAGLIVSIGVKPYNNFDTSYRWAGEAYSDERWRAGRLHLHINGGVLR